MAACLVPGRAAETRELLRDAAFARGFNLLAPRAGEGSVGRIAGRETSEPVWEVAQWHSRFPFSGQNGDGSGAWRVANEARWLEAVASPAGDPTLTMGVDTRPEYGGRLRSAASEPWVHLLLQQGIEDAPPLTRLAALELRLEFQLVEAETFKAEGYTPGLHAAQFQVVLTLNHTRRGAPGFGDYLWFVVPLYDDRHAVPPAYVAQDFAVTRGKLIFNPGGQALGLRPLRVGGWQSLTCDVRPWLERALETAWARGYLVEGRERADYRVAHLNLGWEVPGLNRVAMQVRGLSLQARLTEAEVAAPVLNERPAE
jgi:hypothetical protein